MSWIKTIGYDEASGTLKKIYDRVKGPNNNIDNILGIHSLRPHSLTGHMALYKNVLHNSNNSLPKWFLETIGVYVSYLNQCSYCVDHHFAGLARLLSDGARADQIMDAVRKNDFTNTFDEQYRRALKYTETLTLNPTSIESATVEGLKEVNFSDGEILEINQVCSYFNYVNRTVLGLGVNTDGDLLGLSPNENDDPNNWNHS